jgi:hypothetical protein
MKKVIQKLTLFENLKLVQTNSYMKMLYVAKTEALNESEMDYY